MIYPPRNAFNKEIVKIAKKVQYYYTKNNTDPYVQGNFEKKFCNSFSRFMDSKGYCDAVNSGTVALFIALKSMNLKPKSFVLVPPITDPGSINAVIENGLKIWVTDTEVNSYNVSLDKIKNIILEDKGEKIKAILIVHSCGEVVKVNQIIKICKKYNIKIIEDCSQAHGASINNVKVGNFGDVAAFSMMSRKTITANGSAGMVYTKSKKIYHKCLALADRGKPTWIKKYNPRDPSFNLFSSLNFNLDEFSCAIGNHSMGKIKSIIKKRRSLAKYLKQKINNESKFLFINYSIKESSPFIIPIYFKRDIKVNKKRYIRNLQLNGIPLNPNYKFLITKWKYLNKIIKGENKIKNARENIDNSFVLYLHEKYEKKHVDHIIKMIKKIENEK